jgi:opacity protein-like surface antigen
MRTINIVLLALVVSLAAGGVAVAENYRDVFSYSRYKFDEDSAGASALDRSAVMENSFFLKAYHSASVVIKSFQDVRDGWKNNILSTGTIYKPDKASQVEVTYGYGEDSDGNRANYFLLDITEGEQKELIGLGAQYNKYSDYDYTAIYLSTKYEINKKAVAQGKYYLSYDSEHHYDYRVWAELEYTAYRKIYFDIGLAIGDRFYTEEYGPISRGDYYSVSGGMGLKLSENMSVRYNYEYTSRETEFRDSKSTVSLDWKF